MIEVYTDGSSSIKTGMCGWAIMAQYGGMQTQACGWAKNTNSFAELYAIIYAMRKLPKDQEVVIYSDSEYSIKALIAYREYWERTGFRRASGGEICHRSLVTEGHALKDMLPLLRFCHVRGHTGNPGNEFVDQLAKQARFLGERKTQETPSGLVMLNGRDPDTGHNYNKE